MPQTLPTVTRTSASERPDAPAIVFGERTTTWRELDAASSRVASGLGASGVVDGSRVAVLSKSTDRFFEIFFGAAKAGAVLVPVNWRLASPEIEHILADAEAQVLFVGSEFASLVGAARPRLPAPHEVIVIDHHSNVDPYRRWRQRFEPIDPQRDLDPDAVALQLYTSGTTGRPKGALITHSYFFENFRLVQRIPSRFCDWDPSEATLVTFPLFHIGGLNWAFMGAVQGCTLLVMPDFDPAAILALLSRYRVPALPLVAAMLQAVLSTVGATETDFGTVRHVVYGAAPIPPALLRRAIDMIGCGFVQTYGMTESTIVTVLDAEDHQLPTIPAMLSVGQPMPEIELEIVDDRGAPVPDGEIGEIIVRTPVLMKGYWRQPDATAEVIKDGWFHTGDAGYLSKDGYLYLKDRVKDTIISGGENIYPAEVENALYEHPSIKEVAVVGVPDDTWGEVPKAFIVPEEGAVLDESALLSHTEQRIARYKLPKHFAVVTALPRTASGKVLRRVLRDQS